MEKVSGILCVCLGNICRSPMAEGILRHHSKKMGSMNQISIDSAGTGSWHLGDPPDNRATRVAANHGIDISGLRARQVEVGDFQKFKLILAMDQQNLNDLAVLSPSRHNCELAMYLNYAGIDNQDVNDPYYGNLDDFEKVFNLIDKTAQSILEKYSVQ